MVASFNYVRLEEFRSLLDFSRPRRGEQERGETFIPRDWAEPMAEGRKRSLGGSCVESAASENFAVPVDKKVRHHKVASMERSKIFYKI